MTIYVSGSMAYDRLLEFPGRFSEHIIADKLHNLNVCFTAPHMCEKLGGTAGNIAYSLSLLGEKPIILSTIGYDNQRYLAWLKKNKISIEGIKIIKDAFTASAYIITDCDSNQITGFHAGAMGSMSKYPVSKIKTRGSFGLIAPGNIDDMLAYANIYRKKKVPFICDPGQSLPAWKSGEEFKKWIKGSKILISNDYELGLIMNITGLDKKGLLNLTEMIITTLGENGSIIITKDVETKITTAKPAKVVNPTGAGDAFRAGLLKGLVHGKDIVESCKLGAVSAVYAVEHAGTQDHCYTQSEFTRRHAENFSQ